MKGKLIAQPLAELIREISFKGLSGTLRLEYERAQTAVYFDNGQILYAASNLRTLRLREYLGNKGIISESQSASLKPNLSDLDLAAALVASGTLKQNEVDALLAILVSDILRVALLWTEGTWDFNDRAHLASPIRVDVDTTTLLREAAQRLPFNFVSQRFRNPTETISRVLTLSSTSNFVPAESFILSRLDEPLKLSDLMVVCGLPEPEAQRLIYGLALSGVVTREYWQNAFRTESSQTGKVQTAAPAAPATTTTIQPEPVDNWTSASIDEDDLEKFLQRLRKAKSFYEVIELPATAKATEIKAAYYAMARRYHPDRVHSKSGTKLHAQISSAFARVTQAYETLTDPKARSAYDRNLERSRKFSQTATSSEPEAPVSQPVDVNGEADVEQAEYSFREGFAALQQGHTNAAVNHLAKAAHLDPGKARYRAQYGRALAASEKTRRQAENEIQAAIQLEPANAAFRTMLAELYFDLKFHRRAQTELDRALAIDPKDASAQALLRKLGKSRKVG